MIALGVDYGTTNSIITEFTLNMASKHVVSVHRASAIIDNGEIINSPKRMLNNIQEIKRTQVLEYISRCIKSLIVEIKQRIKNDPVISLAITIPNSFKDTQCKFLQDAIESAFSYEYPGINENWIVSLIPEPVSAALYFSYCMKSIGIPLDEKYIIVSDIGGGTTDLAVVKIRLSGNSLKFNVLCTEHDSKLGGDDIDNSLADYVNEKYNLDKVVDRIDLLKACRFIKENLSYSENFKQIILSAKGQAYSIGGKELEIEVTRNELESALESNNDGKTSFLERYIRKTISLVKTFKDKLLNDEGYISEDVDRIFEHSCILLPIGGTSRIPAIQSVLKKALPNAVYFTLNTENDKDSSDSSIFDSVSRGAAIFAAYKSNLIDNLWQSIEIEDRTLHRYSLKYANEKVVTIVDKGMPDGKHECILKPKYLSDDGKTFSIKKLEFYEGGKSDFIDSDSLLIKSVDIPDIIQTNGRPKDKIKITLTVYTKSGRLDHLELFVPDGKGVGQHYIREINIKK